VIRLAVIVVALVAACAPQQPLQPSFFTAKQDPNAPVGCGETLACYARCQPVSEECMLLCDQKGQPRQVELARQVSYCGARNGCEDQACIDERCAPEMQACTGPAGASAPSPMQPRPYPGQRRP
jgi:hypothetical protein